MNGSYDNWKLASPDDEPRRCRGYYAGDGLSGYELYDCTCSEPGDPHYNGDGDGEAEHGHQDEEA